MSALWTWLKARPWTLIAALFSTVFAALAIVTRRQSVDVPKVPELQTDSARHEGAAVAHEEAAQAEAKTAEHFEAEASPRQVLEPTKPAQEMTTDELQDFLNSSGY